MNQTMNTELNASTVHKIMTSYLSSTALFLGVEFQLFDLLEEGGKSVQEVSQSLKLQERPTRILLKACVGCGLLQFDNDKYINKPITSQYLVSTSNRYMGALATHQYEHFKNFSKLPEALRENSSITKRVGKKGYNNEGAGENETSEGAKRFIKGLHGGAVVQANKLSKSIKLYEKHLVDLGCGSGAYSIAIAKDNPNLKITAMDYQTVCNIAKEHVKNEGLENQITFESGDLFKENLPNGGDVVLLSHVLEGYGRHEAQLLLKKIYDYLPKGGRLLLHAHLPERATSSTPYLFNLILMANTEAGEVHGEEVISDWLYEVGFEKGDVVEISPFSSLIICTKS